MPETTPERTNGDAMTNDEIQALIETRVRESQKEMSKKHQKDMDDLRSALTGVNPSPVATHAGGPGTEIAPTWSAYDQLLATRGDHPWQNQEHADWLVHPDHVENRQPAPWA